MNYQEIMQLMQVIGTWAIVALLAYCIFFFNEADQGE